MQRVSVSHGALGAYLHAPWLIPKGVIGPRNIFFANMDSLRNTISVHWISTAHMTAQL